MSNIDLNVYDAVRLTNMIGPRYQHASLNPDSPFFADSGEPGYITTLRTKLDQAILAAESMGALHFQLTPDELDYLLGWVTTSPIADGRFLYADPILAAIIDGLRP